MMRLRSRRTSAELEIGELTEFPADDPEPSASTRVIVSDAIGFLRQMSIGTERVQKTAFSRWVLNRGLGVVDRIVTVQGWC